MSMVQVLCAGLLPWHPLPLILFFSYDYVYRENMFHPMLQKAENLSMLDDYLFLFLQ